jgi:hypothetical protein
MVIRRSSPHPSPCEGTTSIPEQRALGGLISRRFFLSTGLCALLAGLARAGKGSPSVALAGSPAPPGLDPWVGTGFRYRVSCPALADFAEGELRIQRIRDSAHYLAVLETNLQGLVGILSMQRSDLFASLMEWSRDQGRFLPIWHADQMIRKGVWRRKVLVFRRGGNDYVEYKLGERGTRERPGNTKGQPMEDPFTAFFNWLAGAFGPLGYGRTYTIENLARRDPVVLRFDLVSREETHRERAGLADPGARKFLLRALLERELQESIRGQVDAWLDDEWVPVDARATQVRMVGEVTAQLAGRRRLPGPEREDSPPPPLRNERWSI